MNPCAPHVAVVRRVAAVVRARPRRVTHYVTSHKTHAAAGHHAATGHPAPHLPVRRRPRPVAHHAPPPAADTGACGTSGTVQKLRAGLLGGPAAVGGLAAGGAMAGIGAAAALTPSGSGGPGGGVGGPGSGVPGIGGPGFGGPGFGGPGFGGPGFGGPGSGGPGGGPGGSLPGTPGTSHVDTPPAVSVPEPSSLLVLAMALLALTLTRWVRARR